MYHLENLPGHVVLPTDVRIAREGQQKRTAVKMYLKNLPGRVVLRTVV